MKRLVLLTAFLSTVGAFGAAAVAPDVAYVDHNTVTAALARGGSLIDQPGLSVLVARRGVGQVEVHERIGHVFFMLEGEATLVTGGTPINSRTTGVGEIRATGLEGGQT